MRRERRPVFGMMIQIDGFNHDWFEGRGPYYTLLVYVDDAISKIVWLQFVESESLEDANTFVQKEIFIQEHNAKYAVVPCSLEKLDLDAIFCTQETRVVTNDFTVMYNRKILQLERSKLYLKPKNHVLIKEYLDGSLSIHAKNHYPVGCVLWENKVPDQPQQFLADKPELFTLL